MDSVKRKYFEQTNRDDKRQPDCASQIAPAFTHNQKEQLNSTSHSCLTHTHTHTQSNIESKTHKRTTLYLNRAAFWCEGVLTCNRSWHNACSIDRGCHRPGAWHRRRWWVIGCSVQILRNCPFLQEPLVLQPPGPLGNITDTNNKNST